jgi:ketosteroid isomerase-like protein
VAATTDELAAAFGALLVTGEPASITEHLAPGAVVWHNHDRIDVDAIDNMASVAVLGELVDDLSVEHRLLASTPDGFVLQFVTLGTVRSNGKPFEMHNCIVVTRGDDGRITRIDEYVDPTVGAQLT